MQYSKLEVTNVSDDLLHCSDLEFAAPNPAAFDIARHFSSWMLDYDSPTPHVLDPKRYPTLEQRQNFYRAYLSAAEPVGVTLGKTTPLPKPLTSGASVPTPLPLPTATLTSSSSLHPTLGGTPQANSDLSKTVTAAQIQALEAEVMQAWAPASVAGLTLWGIVQSRDDVLAGRVGEFDFLNLARGQATAFRKELELRGIHV